jgi:hypothetical protein
MPNLYLVHGVADSKMGLGLEVSSRFSTNRTANAKRTEKEKETEGTAAPAIEGLAECHIMGITSIDIMKQQFEADFQLNLSWQDNEFCDWMEKHENKKDFDKNWPLWQAHMFKTCWHPNVMCTNQVDEFFTEQWWSISDNGTNLITLKVRSRGLFTEKFELANFVSPRLSLAV